MIDGRPTFGSLFAGIGGIDLGLERAGWVCRWQVEDDPFCVGVLDRWWPQVARYGDVRGVEWGDVEPVDLVAGGFPCQPVSSAGRQLGRDDPRWLWPEFERALGVLRPRLVLVENVPGLLAHGLGDVLGGLAALGYDARWDCVPALAVGAPHARDRVWIVGRRADHRWPLADPYRGLGHALDRVRARRDEPRDGGPHVADRRPAPGADALVAHPLGQRGRGGDPGGPDATDVDPSSEGPGGDVAHPDGGRDLDGRAPRDRRRDGPPPPSGPDGGPGDRPLHGGWAVEPNVGRVAHGIPRRVDRLRALGNAVVPQVAEAFGEVMRDQV